MARQEMQTARPTPQSVLSYKHPTRPTCHVSVVPAGIVRRQQGQCIPNKAVHACSRRVAAQQRSGRSVRLADGRAAVRAAGLG